MWPFGSPDDPPPPGGLERIESGIPRLDYILKGGFLKGGTYSVIGPPGSGKTILGNQFCFNHVATSDGRCVYMSLLVESYAKMLRHMASLEFFRAEANNKMAKGTGLGLSLVRQIVETVHGGTVFVESQVGKGSCFGFELKLVD